MLLAILLVAFGVLLLYWGAHQLFRSSIQIALAAGVSPLVVGLTLVALATSFPEAMTSAIAQIKGVSGDVALGNVIGSNIANIGLVLGVALLICPIRIPQKIKRIEMPLVLIFSLLLGLIMFLGEIPRWIGVCFLVLACGYLIFEWLYGKNGEAASKNQASLQKAVIFFCLSLIALIFGARGLVDGGVELALLLHVPERVIAVSVVAIGTSLPELVTVILAAAHKKEALILGNVVGSNILNILFIVGLSAVIRPLIFTAPMLAFDIPIMVGFTGVLWISMWRRNVLPRFVGIFYLALYIGYLVMV
ncbi:calcium/sodium antiporter [Simkania sp.]|uniref:calcium/sodium antiporter n=1 Tax=Simkania sp. TaxID=34094 RepID=UPI003B52AE40